MAETALRVDEKVWFAVFRTDDMIPEGELERKFGDYTSGRYGFQLASVVRVPDPVPCRGALSLWHPPPEVLAALEEQVGTPSRPTRRAAPMNETEAVRA